MIWHISKVGLLANGYWSGLVLETAHTVPPTANSDDLKKRKFEIRLEKNDIQIYSCSDMSSGFHNLIVTLIANAQEVFGRTATAAPT